MTTFAVFAGVVFPESLMQTDWFIALSAFVSVNTVAYVTLAIIKTLPKAYLSDWIDRRDRRTEDRSIFPEGYRSVVDQQRVVANVVRDQSS